MLIDYHLHNCTIVILLRMRTREELSLTDSAEICAFESRLNGNKGGAESDRLVTERTNEQTVQTILLGELTDAN